MKPLISIPYSDIREGTPLDLLDAHLGNARSLVVAATNTYGPLGQLASKAVLPLGDTISRRWLERCKNPYLHEIHAIAHRLGRDGVYFFNVCFEWGCTSGVWQTDTGPLLRRVLDWPFPALGEHIVVAHQKGPAGEFLNATWPGVTGIYQASAPGRFAAAINQAPMRENGAGFLIDWLQARIETGKNEAIPPSHLLRQVFETARNYAEAKNTLCRTPLAVPAIFILAGTRTNEGCVIERTETQFALREMNAGRVCATNHFVGDFEDPTKSWRARPIDSEGRLSCAIGLAGDCEERTWFSDPIANINSRLAMTANPSTGEISVFGTEGVAPVTEVFRFAA
jgi:hypothetical protein